MKKTLIQRIHCTHEKINNSAVKPGGNFYTKAQSMTLNNARIQNNYGFKI